jgi:hypothetical protein
MLFLITSVSLLYAYQQTEIFRLAYVGQKKQAVYQDLLDKNNFLRYNIQVNASLVNIGNRISGSSDYVMPDSYRLVRLMPSMQGARPVPQPANKENLLTRILGIKRQAEAETINP